MLRDIRYALRVLVKDPGFGLAAGLAMACGIAACTAVFSLVYGLLLRPLAVPRAQDLVSIYGFSRAQGSLRAVAMPDYRELAATQTDVFEGIGAYMRAPVLIAFGDESERATTELVSGNYHDLLGVRAQVGRMLRPDDDRPGAPAVVVLSDRFWRQRFDARTDAVGRSLRLNGHVYEIVGVAPPSFVGVLLDWYGAPETWTTLSQLDVINKSLARWVADPKHGFPYQLTARLRPGVAVATATAALQVRAGRLVREARPGDPSLQDVSFSAIPVSHARFWPGRRDTVVDFAAVLFATVGVLLVIALLNVANLLLARLTTRAREIGIRLAIGADRVRIARQLIIEALVLSAIATIASVPLSMLLTRAISRMDLPFFIKAHALDMSPDWRIFAGVAALCTACGLLLGLAPAWHAWRADVRSGLVGGSTTRRTILGRWDLRHTLAVLQIAVCVTLTVGAGLLGRRLIGLMHVDLGYTTDRVTLFDLETYILDYTPEQNATLYRRLLDSVRRMPGVEAVGLAANALPTPMLTADTVTAPDAGTRQRFSARFDYVSSGYFDTIQLPLIAGRFFDARDDEGTPARTAILNETAARRLWQDPARAVGQRIRVGDDPTRATEREVVGVVRDAVYGELDEPPMPYLFLPADRSFTGGLTLHVRGPREPTALIADVRRALRTIDPAFAISSVTTLDDHIATRIAAPSLAARLSVAASLTGVLLAMMGLYAVLAYLVAQRQTELAIRMSIGAAPRQIVGFIASFGVKIVTAGIALGLAGAVVATRLLETQLHGVNTRDPVIYAIVIALVAIAAATACLAPARRAARLEPWAILRR